LTATRGLAALLLLSLPFLTACTPHVFGAVDVPGPFVDLEHVSVEPEVTLGGRIL